MQLKKEPFGISSLVEIRGRKREYGSPTKKELGMGLCFGNLLEWDNFYCSSSFVVGNGKRVKF